MSEQAGSGGLNEYISHHLTHNTIDVFGHGFNVDSWAVALGLGHAMPITPCSSAGLGVLRRAVLWLDACESQTLPMPSGDPGSEPLPPEE